MLTLFFMPPSLPLARIGSNLQLWADEAWWKGQLDFLWAQRLKSEETQPFILKSHPIGPSEGHHQWLESSAED